MRSCHTVVRGRIEATETHVRLASILQAHSAAQT